MGSPFVGRIKLRYILRLNEENVKDKIQFFANTFLLPDMKLYMHG